MCVCVALAVDPLAWPAALAVGIAYLVITYLWAVVALAAITAAGWFALLVYLARQESKPVVRIGLAPPERGALVRVYARPRPARLDAPVRITAIRAPRSNAAELTDSERAVYCEPCGVRHPAPECNAGLSGPTYALEDNALLREKVTR